MPYRRAAIASSINSTGSSIYRPVVASFFHFHCWISFSVFTQDGWMCIFRPFKKSIWAFTLPGSFFTGRARKPAFCHILIRSGSAESQNISTRGGDVGFSGQGDDLFRILFEDIDFGRNVDLPVLPTDPQDRVSMIKAKVLAIIEAVKAVLACGGNRGLQSSSGSARLAPPFAQTVNLVSFRVFQFPALHAPGVAGSMNRLVR